MSLIMGFIILVVAILLVNNLWCFWSRSKVCLVGKTALITGGASGLGFQTALALASKGCRVIIADVANMKRAVDQLIETTHNPNIIGKCVDLQSFKSVRELTNDILATEPKLNILICNAGILGFYDGKKTEDGLQTVMQVNYFSHFLLTHLLIDLLKKSSHSRVIFTSSQAAYISNLSIDNLNPKEEYFHKYTTRITGGCYSNSKLALAGAAKMFGKKLEGTGVTVNAVHPGMVRTPIYKNTLKIEKHPVVMLLTALAWIFGKNQEAGAQTLIHLAQADEVQNITGQSFVEGMKVPKPFQLNNDDFCQQIWDKSIEYIQLKPHEIKC